MDKKGDFELYEYINVYACCSGSGADFEKLHAQYFSKQGFLTISLDTYYRRKKWLKC